jgi:hypothetical protein
MFFSLCPYNNGRVKMAGSTHPNAPKVANLVYDAAAEVLRGSIGALGHFNFHAYSGGSRGHKQGVAANVASRYLHGQANAILSRLATTKEIMNAKGEYEQRGGTLPPGHYLCKYVQNHSSFHECILLAPQRDAFAIHSPFALTAIVHGRGGFYIHGRGPKGSDGCIVPANEGERRRLNQAIKNFDAKVILQVIHVSYMLPAENFDGNIGHLA